MIHRPKRRLSSATCAHSDQPAKALQCVSFARLAGRTKSRIFFGLKSIREEVDLSSLVWQRRAWWTKTGLQHARSPFRMASGTWRALSVQSSFPASRSSHSAILSGDKIIIFGGHGHLIPKEGSFEGQGRTRQLGNTNDICLIDIKTLVAEWLQPAQGRGRSRVGHAAVSVGGDMYTFGGWSGARAGGSYLNYGFLFDINARQLMTESIEGRELPAGRRDHSLTFVPDAKKIVLFGGWNMQNSFNDVWTCTPDQGWAWARADTLGNVPGKRRGHTATCVDGKIFVFGGIYGFTRYFNDIFCLDCTTWEWTIPQSSGTPPSPRAWHSAVRVGDTSIILFFGGSGGRDRFYNDAFTYDTETGAWDRVVTRGAQPAARCSHTAVIADDIDRMYVFGGLTWQNGKLLPSGGLFAMDIELTSNEETRRKLIEDRKTKAQALAAKFSSLDAKTPESWLTIQNLKKRTWSRGYFKLCPGDLRWHECVPWAELDLDTEELEVATINPNLEDPFVMLLDQTEASDRVTAFLEAARKNHTNEYPEFYLAVRELERLKPNSEEYLGRAREIFETFLDEGGDMQLSTVRKREIKRLREALEAENVPFELFINPIKQTLSTLRAAHVTYFSDTLQRTLTPTDKKRKMCYQSGIKFNDFKGRVSQRVCAYCLGVFSDECLTGKAMLPKLYSEDTPQRVCRPCELVLEKKFAGFKLVGFHAQRTGVFEKKTSRAGASSASKSGSAKTGPDVPHTLQLAAENPKDRDAWIKAIQDASVAGSEESARNTHFEGWLLAKPQFLRKGEATVWVRKYAVLDRAMLRLLDVRVKGMLSLERWDVHSFNARKPTLPDEKDAGAQPAMSTQNRFPFHFSVSNRNDLYKLAAETAFERSHWLRALQRKKAIEAKITAGDTSSGNTAAAGDAKKPATAT